MSEKIPTENCVNWNCLLAIWLIRPSGRAAEGWGRLKIVSKKLSSNEIYDRFTIEWLSQGNEKFFWRVSNEPAPPPNYLMLRSVPGTRKPLVIAPQKQNFAYSCTTTTGSSLTFLGGFLFSNDYFFFSQLLGFFHPTFRHDSHHRRESIARSWFNSRIVKNGCKARAVVGACRQRFYWFGKNREIIPEAESSRSGSSWKLIGGKKKTLMIPLRFCFVLISVTYSPRLPRQTSFFLPFQVQTTHWEPKAKIDRNFPRAHVVDECKEPINKHRGSA